MPCTPTVQSTRALVGAPSGLRPRMRAASLRSHPWFATRARARAVASARATGTTPVSRARARSSPSGEAIAQKRLSLLLLLASRGCGERAATPSRCATAAGVTTSWGPSWGPRSSRRRSTHTSRWSSPDPPMTCSHVSVSYPQRTRGSARWSVGMASASLRAPTPPAGSDTARRSTTLTSKARGARGRGAGSEAWPRVADRPRAPSRPRRPTTSPARAH
mmetsp:Transcript_14078/g.37885  ORF Transcript_14078/g.37885 Transcript_14078/m.37885 type:complete len:219 (+) Transcript_14078:1424-2080(+)